MDERAADVFHEPGEDLDLAVDGNVEVIELLLLHMSLLFEVHNYKQHQTLQQRFEAAELLTSQVDMPCPLLIDTMSDDANLKYAAVPERLYVISDGVVKYRSVKGPWCYVTAMNQMRQQLSKYK